MMDIGKRVVEKSTTLFQFVMIKWILKESLEKI